MAWGTLEFKYSQILEFILTMRGKKGKERKILTCDKVNYRMRHQFGVCGDFAWASFVLLPRAELFVQGGCVR